MTRASSPDLQIWKAKNRRRTRRAARERALNGGQDAYGANSMMKQHMDDRKQQLQIALSLLPSFEFGKLSLPPSTTPLDELPSFEQRQLDQVTGKVDTSSARRSESLPTSSERDKDGLERSGSKLGAGALSRAKSLKAKAASLSASGKKPRDEDEPDPWCASSARDPPP